MLTDDASGIAPRIPAALFAGLALALVALVIAFTVSFRLANRQFELATTAERQATAVAQIVAAAAMNDEPGRLHQSLASYRQLIDEEQALLAFSRAQQDRQRHEATQADRLMALAARPADRAAFHSLARAIDRQEGAEVLEARRDLKRLHGRTVTLAALLAGAALLCAVTGGFLLARRNRSLEAMVRARTARIEEVDRSRRLFFAKASHELRTPVTAMRGEAEVALASDGEQGQALRVALEHILANTIFLGHRIDELLGLASADDGKLQLDRAPVDMVALAEEAVGSVAPFARSVDVDVRLSGPDRPMFLTGDARWLGQALLTILDNGLKFSPMGGALEVTLTAEQGAVAIAITDHGPGVMPPDLPRIFDAYYQGAEGRLRGGSGLGLALARWVVEQHGGTIEAHNRAGGGCRIAIVLPAGRAA